VRTVDESSGGAPSDGVLGAGKGAVGYANDTRRQGLTAGGHPRRRGGLASKATQAGLPVYPARSQPDGVRVLDDRSLNGVFVNGARVDGKALQDGDEIIVGRYRLLFVSVPADGESTPGTGSGPTSVRRTG
jgi:hypothetical protein